MRDLIIKMVASTARLECIQKELFGIIFQVVDHDQPMTEIGKFKTQDKLTEVLDTLSGEVIIVHQDEIVRGICKTKKQKEEFEKEGRIKMSIPSIHPFENNMCLN